MFCYNCGAKIMDFAKFCPLCGSKQIPLEEMENAQDIDLQDDITNNNVAEDEYEKVSMDANNLDNKASETDDGGEEVVENGERTVPAINSEEETAAKLTEIVLQLFVEKLTAEEARYLDCRRPFQEFMLKAVDTFKIFREKNVHTLDDIISKSLPALSKYLEQIVNLGVETLLDHSIDYVDQATLKKMLLERCPMESVFDELIDAENQISIYAEQLGIESNSGMRFSGGGFGLGGAIKGVIEAEILNLGADALSGIGKWLTGNTDNDKMKRFQKELFENMDKNFEENVVIIWGHGVFAEVWEVLTQDNEFSDIHFDEQKASAKLNNTLLLLQRKKYTVEQAFYSLMEGLSYNPYDDGYYMPLLCLMPKARNGLMQLAKKAGMMPAFLPILAQYDELQKKDLIKKYTQDQAIIDQSEYVATNQEELSEMLDDEDEEDDDADGEAYSNNDDDNDDNDDVIYLIENEYSLPAQTRNVRFIGLGHVVMHIESDEVIDFNTLGITFENIEFDEKYMSVIRAAEMMENGAKLLFIEKYDEALAALEEARNLGNGNAANFLGWMFEHGLGVDADEKKAKSLYAEAKGNILPSALWIGLRYKNGSHSVAADYDKAIQWLEKVPSSPIMVTALAELYEKGVNGRNDINEALSLYQKVCKMGVPPMSYYALYKCAMLSDTDIAQKAMWLEEASMHEVWDATYQLGLLHLKNYEEAFKETKSAGEKKAVECFQKASAEGVPDAAYQMGLAYLDGRGVEHSDRLAVDYFRKAADKGHIEATVELGVCYANGTGIKQNYERAVELYRIAADKGNDEAQLNLGICYQYGAGVEKNMEEAVRWYKLALDNGNTEAADMLNKAKEIMLQSYM